MPRKPNLSPQQEIEVCSLYKSGKRTPELSEMFQSSKTTITNALKKHGVPFHPNWWSEDGRKRISVSAKRQWENGKKPPTKGYKYTDEQKQRMSLAHQGKNNRNWKGGQWRVGGYIYEFAPNHPSVQDKSKKYVAAHRLAMEKHIGRYLEPQENVHHRNGIKDDNRIENLEIVAHANHYGEVKCPHCQSCFKIK